MRWGIGLALLLGTGTGATAAPPGAVPAMRIADLPQVATVRAPQPLPRSFDYRLTPIAAPADPTFRLDAPQGMLHTGFGNSMVDVFPFGNAFHLSAGGKLFGRPGRLRVFNPDNLRLLPPFRMAGMRMARKFNPAVMVGIGRPKAFGLALGLDAGMVMGRINPGLGRIGGRHGFEPRGGAPGSALAAADTRRRTGGMNPLARATMLYRF